MTPRAKKAVKYHGISLPVPLIEEIKKHIQDQAEYRSVADFVKEAIRRMMRAEKYILYKKSGESAKEWKERILTDDQYLQELRDNQDFATKDDIVKIHDKISDIKDKIDKALNKK